MTAARGWKVLHASVRGTAHEHREQPCQDAACTGIAVTEGEEVLVAACADGAGSARFADVGARIAVQAFVVAALAEVRAGLSPKAELVSQVRAWVQHARNRLSFEACFCNEPLRDYACTLLGTVVWERRILLAQIGDGAIVLGDGDGFRPAFWPQMGEYANQTYFLTDDGFEQLLLTDVVDTSVSRLALFTDGLQRLALHEASRTAHGPFFAPLFARLLGTADPAELTAPLHRWLNSETINERTDDDKTLVLAVR